MATYVQLNNSGLCKSIVFGDFQPLPKAHSELIISCSDESNLFNVTKSSQFGDIAGPVSAIGSRIDSNKSWSNFRHSGITGASECSPKLLGSVSIGWNHVHAFPIRDWRAKLRRHRQVSLQSVHIGAPNA